MNSYFYYLVQSSCSFAVMYTLFYFFFRKLTFHGLNRILLLLILSLSIVFPVLGSLVPSIGSFEDLGLVEFNRAMVDLETSTYINNVVTDQTNYYGYFPIFVLVYWIGFLVGAFRFVSSLFKIMITKRKARPLKIGKYPLLQAEVPSIFSWFRWIFVPKGKTYSYSEAILAHEFAHVKMGHTIDLFLVEIYILFCWFNPLVYAFRRSVRSIHEFQADKAAIGNHFKKSDYLDLLLNNIKESYSSGLQHYFFNESILEKRIQMISRKHSKNVHLMKYSIFAPVFVVLTYFFTKEDGHPTLFSNETFAIITMDEPPSIFPVKNGNVNQITNYFGKTFMHPIRKTKLLHKGIDIKSPEGTPIVATADGVISFAQNKDDWGNLIIINHANGYQTRYAHLKSFEINDKQTVKKGEVIGYVGSTGLSNGSHLHYEVLKDGKELNPLDFLEI